MTTSIVEYSKTEAALSELREQYGANVWVVDTPERMANAKKARNEIRKWRLDLEAERKRIKAPALEHCKAIDAEAKRITAELLALENPVADAIKEVEQAKKREEERLKREEEERIIKARAEIDRIRNVPVGLIGADIGAVHTAAEELKSLDLSWLAEFSGVGQAARDEAVGKLRALYVEMKKQQEEKEKVEKERAELDRLRAVQAENDRLEREKREADERERRAKLEADEKESRERIEAKDREAREKREKAEAESLKALEEEEKRLRVERENVEAERHKQEEAKRKEEKKRNDLLSARGMLSGFRERFGAVEEFAEVVAAIDRYFEK